MNVLLCSSNPSLVDRWHQILEKENTIYTASSIREIQEAAATKSVDLFVIHRSLVDRNFLAGLDTAPYLVLTDIPQDEEAVSMLKLGALGYANAYISPPGLIEMVRAGLAGRVWIGRQLMQKIIRGTTATMGNDSVSAAREPLTERESEVAELVRRGLSNLEIAAELDISERTVKAHISALFKKTGTASRLQLALYMNNSSSNR